MSWVPLLLAALQATWSTGPGRATVGDTVVLARAVPAPVGATARTQALQASELLEPLAPPAIAHRQGAIQIVHLVAFFTPGTHRVPMPTVEVVSPDGHAEMVLGDTAVVTIMSVLPDTGTRPVPRGSRAPVARPLHRPEPLVLLVSGVVLMLALWALARRRTRPRQPAEAAPPAAVDPPLMQWLSAGEARAVATLAADRLRRHLSQIVPEAGLNLTIDECLRIVEARRPDWPVDALADVLTALERARFSPLVASDTMALTDRTEELLEELRDARPEASLDAKSAVP